MSDEADIAARFALLTPHLDSRGRRLLAAAESLAIGRGGASRVARATGVSRAAIRAAMGELTGPEWRETLDPVRPGKGRIRRKGGGRKKTAHKDATLQHDLERLIDPGTVTDVEPPLRWTCKSVRALARELEGMGHRVSHTLVAKLLRDMEFRLEAHTRAVTGPSYPDCNAQFEFVRASVCRFLAERQPAIFVETKMVADDPENRLTGPGRVDHQVPRPRLAKLEADSDNAAFAVESIRRWWRVMGRETYPAAHRLLVTAASGGGRVGLLGLWKTGLREFASEAGLAISVCRLPPGTAKWNRMEQGLSSFFRQDSRGGSPAGCTVTVNLISPASAGPASPERGQAGEITIPTDQFPSEWNYIIADDTKSD